MKQKKPGKKLILNKKTIAALDSRQLKAAFGGTQPITVPDTEYSVCLPIKYGSLCYMTCYPTHCCE